MAMDVLLLFPFVVLFGGPTQFSFEFFGQAMSFSMPAFLHANAFLIDATRWIFQIDGLTNFPLMGLVLIFNVSSLVEFSLLFIYFYKKVGDFGLKQIGSSFIKICAATIFMGAVGIFSLAGLERAFGNNFWGMFGQFVFAGLISVAAYLFVTLALKSPETKFVLKYFQQQHTSDNVNYKV